MKQSPGEISILGLLNETVSRYLYSGGVITLVPPWFKCLNTYWYKVISYIHSEWIKGFDVLFLPVIEQYQFTHDTQTIFSEHKYTVVAYMYFWDI